ITDPVVTLNATDYSTSGILKTEYSEDALTWTVYAGPFVYTTEGQSTLYYRSEDKEFDIENNKSQAFKVDTRPPVITSDLAATYPRNSPIVLGFGAPAPVPGSGLASVSGLFNGMPVTPGQAVDLFWASLGTYTLYENASDIAGL